MVAETPHREEPKIEESHQDDSVWKAKYEELEKRYDQLLSILETSKCRIIKMWQNVASVYIDNMLWRISIGWCCNSLLFLVFIVFGIYCFWFSNLLNQKGCLEWSCHYRLFYRFQVQELWYGYNINNFLSESSSKKVTTERKENVQLTMTLLILYIYVLEKLLPSIIATLIAVVSLAAQEKQKT